MKGRIFISVGKRGGVEKSVDAGTQQFCVCRVPLIQAVGPLPGVEQMTARVLVCVKPGAPLRVRVPGLPGLKVKCERKKC